MKKEMTMTNQSEVKYNRLMEKAESLFIEYGYKSVSMNQIAEAAGISKMTIYKYFPTKEELFMSVLQLLMDKSYDYIDDRLKNIEGIIEKIDELLKYGIESSRNYSLVFYKDIMDNPIISAKVLQEKKRKSKEIFIDIIRTGKKRGEVRDVDEVFMANMLMALIDGTTANILNNIHDMKDIEDFAEKFYDFLKYGLLGGKGVK